MLRDIPIFLLALIPVSVWLVFVLPVLYRLWGISLPLNPRKRSEAGLSGDGKIFLQGISVSVSLAIFDLASVCIRWAIYRNPLDRPNLGMIVHAMGLATTSFILVVMFEGLSGGLKRKERSNNQLQK